LLVFEPLLKHVDIGDAPATEIELQYSVSTKSTQAKIKNAAVAVFNELGSSNVSTNLIAERSGLSRGNLYYHYKSKKELIQAIYEDVVAEIDLGWYGDERDPTVSHMAEMFARQIDLIWRYRFLYREAASLTRDDAILAERMRETRDRRIGAIVEFFQQLVAEGYMRKPRSRKSLEYLVTMTWIFSENWLNFRELQSPDEDEDAAQQGYDLILEMLYPYLTARGKQQIFGSYDALKLFRNKKQEFVDDDLPMTNPDSNTTTTKR